MIAERESGLNNPRVDDSDWSRAAEVPGDWTKDAACLGLNNPLMITAANVFTRRMQIELAQDLCDGCPVKRKCREWAATARHGYFEGVAGGLLFPSGGMCPVRLPEGQIRSRDRWCAQCQGYGKAHSPGTRLAKTTA